MRLKKRENAAIPRFNGLRTRKSQKERFRAPQDPEPSFYSQWMLHRVTVNAVPFPSSLLTVIFPRCISTMLLAMDSPSPFPGISRL